MASTQQTPQRLPGAHSRPRGPHGRSRQRTPSSATGWGPPAGPAGAEARGAALTGEGVGVDGLQGLHLVALLLAVVGHRPPPAARPPQRACAAPLRTAARQAWRRPARPWMALGFWGMFPSSGRLISAINVKRRARVLRWGPPQLEAAVLQPRRGRLTSPRHTELLLQKCDPVFLFYFYTLV